MNAAAQEGKQIALQKGSLHNRVPAITVVRDSGWSNRTHKHSYNAKSGVAIIIGQATRKLLHLGVRNKYCSVSTVVENQKVFLPQHDCNRNWDGPSCSMEMNILVNAFKEAKIKYGLHSTAFVGDGDSSVNPSLSVEDPGWCIPFEKSSGPITP